MPDDTMNKTEAKTSLKKRLSSFIEDTVTLDVLTLTGTIKTKVKSSVPDAPADAEKPLDEFKWDDIFKSIAADLKTDDKATEVSILAYTHAEWDQDSVNFCLLYTSDAADD